MSLVDLGKRLLDAAKRGDTDEVRALMSNGAPFTTDWLGTSPLHFAAQFGHISTAEVLLRAGISRDARTKVDRTPLHVACQEGYSEIVDLLLNHSADIEAKDMLKMTPLHWSVENGHLEVINSLLKRGANVGCSNKFDKTPIDIAYSRGRPDIVQLLQSAESAKAVEDAEECHLEATTVEESIEEVTTTDNIVTAESIDENGTTTVTIGDGSDQSSTSVLATLAALAEATAPFPSGSSGSKQVYTTAAEALNWLETHGITMISAGDSPGIVSSALEPGHILTLTEAGKLALNSVKTEDDDGEVVEEEAITETIIDGELHEVVEEDDETQKVITIVSDGNIGEGAVMVVEDGGQITEVVEEEDISDEPPYKRLKTEDETIIITAVGEDGQEVAISEEDQENLRKQLQQAQKEAAAYKQQLKQKELEAEEYKKKLNKMTPVKS